MAEPDVPPAEADAELQRLRDAVRDLERDLALSRELLRRTTVGAAANAEELTRTRRLLSRFRARRVIRLALRASSVGGPLVRALRGAVALPSRLLRRSRNRVITSVRRRSLRASVAAEMSLAAAVRRQLSRATVTSGPLVSIVILNRNGRQHLERCLEALDRTTYATVEVIVVDNGSTDGSADWLESRSMRFPLRVIRNARNRSFSEANGQGVSVARGDLICFLNNDVDPVTEDWLGYLVETITTTDAVAVGARLIYPRHRGGARGGPNVPDLTLQHAGVEFDRGSPIPMPRVIGVGEDPLSAAASTIVERPALTAACLLVERGAFEAVGGFTLGYEYGMEDVDLCLKLRAAGGRLVYDGRAALWHHESATRAADRKAYAARSASNRELLVDHWGPRLFREALLDALEGGAASSADPFHVAIAITSDDPTAAFGDWYTGHELGDELEKLGWRVSYLQRAKGGWHSPEASVEAVIVLLDALDVRKLPRNVISIAWIRSWAERWLARPWFDDYDLVFGSSQRIVDLVRERSAKVAEVLPLATNPDRFKPSVADPARACDVVFVGNYWGHHREVVDALPALAAHGLTVRVHGRGWDAVPAFASLDHGYLEYDAIPVAYASARIVVDDAAIYTNAAGSVNSRVFDALATGATVVTNGAVGVEELFGDGFPTWTDAGSLVDAVMRLLEDGAAARANATRHRETVLAAHTYRHRAATVHAALVRWATALRYGIRVGVPGWESRDEWGDYHFARGVQRALERRGRPTRVHLLPDWEQRVAAREDVTLHLAGLKDAPTRRGQVNLLWQISHPDRASPATFDRYDHAYVASDSFAAKLAPLCRVEVTPLHQATDPERFRPDPTGPRHELLFVGNSRRVRRRIVDDLAGTPYDLAVYGREWTSDLIDLRLVAGEHVPNTELHRYYSSADVVLNDHWDDMRTEGFLSNRLYDALACAAFVVSDHVPGIDSEFDGAVATYRSKEELADMLQWYLENPEERRRLGELGRRVVLERHTFGHRADVLVQVAERLAGGRSQRIRPQGQGSAAR